MSGFKPRVGTPQRRLDYSVLIEQELGPWSVWRAGETQWRSRCPIHRGDNNTTFSIFANGRWLCHKCQARGDMPRLLMALHHMTLDQARKVTESAPNRFVSMAQVRELPPYSERSKAGAVEYELLKESVLGPYRNNCPRYLLNRRFSSTVLQKYEIGYDLEHSKIVIPVRDVKRRLVGLTYRIDYENDQTQKSKYWHDNFQKARHLYGFYMHAGKRIKELWLTEGQLDTVRLAQLDIPACAIMGSTISKEQVELLMAHAQCDRLVLAFDNDEAGSKATTAAVKMLTRTRFGRDLATAYFTTKDPGELDENYTPKTLPWYSSMAAMLQ